jgi:hypothetical protein
LNIVFISFIQTGISEAALYFVGAIIRRLRHLLYSGDSVSFYHQLMFSRHIPVSNPRGSMGCANWLSCRFVDARYNFNRTTALLTGFYIYPKKTFKSLRPGQPMVVPASLCQQESVY